MKVAISLDSVCDLSAELIKKYNFELICYPITMGDEVFRDGEKTPEEIYDYCDNHKTLPKTMALNVQEFTEYFEGFLKEYDALIHFSLSSQMSSTYNNAVAAAKEFDGRVFIIDSKTLSTGMALEAIYARKLADKGLDAKDIVEKVEARIPYVQASFVLERLDYLYKGGRCSALAMFGANLLNIRPQIEVLNGKMDSTAKYRGKMPDVVKKYCAAVLEKYNNPDKSVIFVTHATATPEMVEAAKEMVKDLGFKEVYETVAGCTVSSHCGRNTIGILYINDGLNED